MTTTVLDLEVRASTPARAFERWGIAAYLVAVAGLVGVIVLWLDGGFAYVLDDAAIHLGMADNLVHHGTWGVSAGVFESASSSPLWTLLVAAGLAVTPVGEQWVPLVLNVLAGLAVVVILGRHQTVVTPTRRQPLDLVATATLVVVGLFLPGLAVVGMEHTLHVALVLAAVVVVQRQLANPAEPAEPLEMPRFESWLPCLLLALAALTRFETAFVAAGLAVGVVVKDGVRWWDLRRRWRPAASLVLAVVVPIGVFGLWNRIMGGGWLPNPVLAKGQGVGTSNSRSDGVSPLDVLERFTTDPLLVALLGVAVTYLVFTWGKEARYRVTAVTLVVAALFHATFADMGWYERYQAYLIAIGIYLALGVIAELPAELRRRALFVLVAASLLFAGAKERALVKANSAADDMYRHQYQAGQFLGEYYDGQSVATDQLGYISLFHDGPLTDLGGLGDYEGLQRMPDSISQKGPLWERLATERGVRVVALYDRAAFGAPDAWVLVGRFRMEGKPITGVSTRMEFWATTPDEVGPLLEHLEEFASQLPPRVSLEVNELAEFQASARRAEEGTSD
jgi:hypothetical protein